MPDQRASRRRFIAGALGGGALLVSGCGQQAAAPPPPPPPVLPTEATASLVTVKRGDLVETTIINGQLTAAFESSLFFRQAGRLKNLVVSSSDRVKAGQLLAELDAGTLGNDVALAEIAMKKAQALLDQARSKGADRFQIQALQIDLDSARLSYEQLNAQLTAAKLVAPFDGLVTETTGRPGEMVPAFNPVVTVADPTELQVTAHLADPSDVSRLAIGQPGTIILDKLPNAKLPLQVVQLPTSAPTLLNGTPTPSDVARSFKLNPTQPFPKDLEIGMLGRLTLVLREKKGVLMVKSTAVRITGPRRYVQMLQDGRKRDVDVETGIVTPTDTEIVTGLSEGDRVVDGQHAAPAPAGTPSRRG